MTKLSDRGALLLAIMAVDMSSDMTTAQEEALHLDLLVHFILRGNPVEKWAEKAWEETRGNLDRTEALAFAASWYIQLPPV
jgi:hypothetical protein